MMPVMVTADVVERNARLRGDAAAFCCDGQVLTHRAFAHRAYAMAHALLAGGPGHQARVALLSGNRVEYFEIFAACGAAGLITVNLNWRLSVAELVAIVTDCEPAILIFEASSAQTAAALRQACPSIQRCIALDAAPGWAEPYEALVAASPTARPAVKVQPEDIESLIYTSGTTGRPKGVMLSHRALLNGAQVISWEGDARTTDRLLIVMPLFHLGGKIEQMAFWLTGATTILHRSFDATAVLRALAEQNITAAHLAPTMVAMLLDHPDLGQMDRRALRVVHYASAPMAVPLLRRAIAAFGPIFLQVYGMTECITCSILKPHQHVLDGDAVAVGRLASAGQPCFGVAVRVVATDGRICDMDELGEVQIKAGGLMSGYWNRHGLSLATIEDGWFRTGDIGRLDADGFLFIADRVKDMIISGGENIYSREVEDALMSHPAVHEASVVGIADPIWGESVLAYIVRRPGQGADAEALIAHARTQIASYKKPRHIVFIPALPRLFNGKVDKKTLRAQGPADVSAATDAAVS